MKVYGYTRVSGESQSDRDGPDRQRTAISRFAADREIEWFEDVVSGTVAKRPQFDRMLRSARKRGIDCIAIESIDRLARDVFVLIILLRRLHHHGLGLLEVAMGLDLVEMFYGTPDQRCVVLMRGVMAETDKGRTVHRLREARERIRSAGQKCEGRHRYAEKDNGEKVILSTMIQRRREQHSYAQVAEYVNSLGMRMRSGGEWTGPQVGRLLRRGRDDGPL